jgi:hypothetical protein
MKRQTFTFAWAMWDVDAAQARVDAGAGNRVRVNIADLTGITRMVYVDEVYAATHPTPDAPVVLASMPTSEGFFSLPIDGWHRIAHWRARGAETIAAVQLDPPDSYQTLLSGKDIYRRLAKKADPSVKLTAKRTSR